MPLTCWTISDGAAGNRRQARALAAALTVDEREVQLAVRPPWRWLAPRRLPPTARAFGAGFEQALQEPLPPLAIGCGRQAALATRWLHDAGTLALQLLDPRIDPAHWDAVIAPAHDQLSGSNVISTLGSLNPVDDPWLAEARVAWPGFGTLPRPRTLLLLGGPTAAVPLSTADWRAIAASIEDGLARLGGSLLVTSSRRTPAWLRAAARERFADTPGRQWHGPVDGDNPYPGMLGWADRIIVSADSVNLLSEACATGVPVHSLLPARPIGRIAAFHRALLDSGRLRPLDAGFEHWRYEPLREAAVVAAELRRRFPRLAVGRVGR